MNQPKHLPLPEGALPLATTVRSHSGRRWTTQVWREDDGRFGGSLVERRGGLVTVRSRHERVSSLRELDELFSGDLRRSGPDGDFRIVALVGAVAALEEAESRSAA